MQLNIEKFDNLNINVAKNMRCIEIFNVERFSSIIQNLMKSYFVIKKYITLKIITVTGKNMVLILLR